MKKTILVITGVIAVALTTTGLIMYQQARTNAPRTIGQPRPSTRPTLPYGTNPGVSAISGLPIKLVPRNTG